MDSSAEYSIDPLGGLASGQFVSLLIKKIAANLLSVMHGAQEAPRFFLASGLVSLNGVAQDFRLLGFRILAVARRTHGQCGENRQNGEQSQGQPVGNKDFEK